MLTLVNFRIFLIQCRILRIHRPPYDFHDFVEMAILKPKIKNAKNSRNSAYLY